MGVVMLVRHGQASFGTADYDVLSSRGVRQSRKVAQTLAGYGVAPTTLIHGGMRRQRETARRDQGVERAAVDDLHREEGRSRRLLDGVDGHDVRMIEGGDRFGFALKARAARGIVGGLARQDFQRDTAFESRILRFVDLAHPAGAQTPNDPVVAQR